MTNPKNINYGTIWLIAFPIIVGSIAQNVVMVTDTAFLGHVGKIALGASAIGGLFYLSCFMLLWGFSIGTQIIIARRFGERKLKQIGETWEHAYYSILAMAIIILVLIQFFGSNILQHIILSDEILEESVSFLKYRSWGILFAGTNLVFRAFYIGIAKTKIISISTIIMAIINILFDYLLIFGKGGFPQMGIDGAALASVFAEAVTTAIFIAYTLKKITLKDYALFRFGKFDFGLQKRLSKVAFPMMLQFYISVAAWFVFFLLVEKMGDTELAVSNIMRSTVMVLMMPIWGFASAGNSLTSQLIGRKQSHLVMPMVWKAIKLALILVAATVALGLISPKLLIGIYTDDAELINASIPVFYVICLASFFFTFTFILFQSVSGTGNTLMALFIEMLAVIVYLSYVYVVVYFSKFPIHLVWTSELVYAGLLAILSYLYLRYGNWRQKQV